MFGFPCCVALSSVTRDTRDSRRSASSQRAIRISSKTAAIDVREQHHHIEHCNVHIVDGARLRWDRRRGLTCASYMRELHGALLATFVNADDADGWRARFAACHQTECGLSKACIAAPTSPLQSRGMRRCTPRRGAVMISPTMVATVRNGMLFVGSDE